MSGTGARSSHLSQPVVKSVLVYRNGDPFFAGRRVVFQEKKVSSFDVFLKEVTGGVQAPFGAVRNIYTPRTGHRIRKLDQIQSGGNYVAGGQEAFKKLNYLDIGEVKKRPMDIVNTEVKPVIHSKINVSARFRKPLQEPRTIFLIANGDLINPASRLLIPRKALTQWDHVLQMITEKITLRSGAVHRLYTLEGKLVESGAELENGQFYVAVGRDRFKKLPYSELLFDKSTMRRPFGQKASSLPPIVGSRKSKGSCCHNALYSSTQCVFIEHLLSARNSSRHQGNDRQSKSTVGSSDNSSPQPLKRKGKKEEANSEKQTKVKQNVKLKSSQQAIPNSDEGIFKAGAERSETRGAAEVHEDEDTQVEVPVDQRPAEIVDEEEDGEKANKDAEQKEDFSGMNGDIEEEGGGEDADAPEQVEEILDHSEEQAAPARVNVGTDEENGEELDQVHNELQPAVEEERKSQGAGNEQDEAELDPERPARPEVKITSPQENENNEQNKDYAVVA
ncbi:doublecortin domain-containing protein 2 isoform X1 [Lemur catta]|uniref:doublecortin domain-containing protein 2 isoform X1 n=1 Tax=Lemur catta TaxID=9447 RepID=UPI001E26DC1E|nr:doublecortin domain-containing protein 2 isoform X1 [Lemur catta]XP_045407839.1 doublecortin domain-containing protein 2 isoform X1 [Lemur catta]XP_045407840.1 doublecortin domain-containing protein 2 isoform X1 [Lemur catta]XP_045407841.1 doublecortin domain-containing protein 2 isoform X1 [Lemur catta]XP_045407842.1 doublecortin domain-containing protein 2 isoform X1 [Lemur catta]